MNETRYSLSQCRNQLACDVIREMDTQITFGAAFYKVNKNTLSSYGGSKEKISELIGNYPCWYVR